MDVKFSLLKPGDKQLLIPFIRKILKEGNSHNFNLYDQRYWEWQYEKLTTGYSKIYIAQQNDAIIGYYHVPVYFASYNGKQVKLAAVQDVAVDKSTRGLGIFKRLSEFAEKDLSGSDIEMVYTFPNQKSIHTFLKYNSYNYIKTLDTYILLLHTAPIIKKKLRLPIIDKAAGFLIDFYSKTRTVKIDKNVQLELTENFNEELEKLYIEYSSWSKISLNRTTAYLNWRYRTKPGANHFFITLKAGGEIKATGIFKIDEIMDAKALLLMDFAFKDQGEKYMLQLLQLLKSSEIINEPYQLMVTSGSDPFLKVIKKVGFLKVPNKFNPRKLNLLVRSNKPGFEVSDPESWRITFSDWDVL